MVRRFLSVIPLVLSVIAAVSGCSRRVEGGYKTIAYVSDLLTDSLPRLQSLAALSGKASGSIVLVGDPSECLRVGERMMLCDEFDNIDARRTSDGLPDFAGETIVPVLDFSGDSYVPVASNDKKSREKMRETAVRSAVAALRIPSRCKILVICSPALSADGGDDVRDLFERIGCDVPVISSPDTSFSLTAECFRKMRERNLFTHNLAYPSARLFAAVRDSVDSQVTVMPFADSLVPVSFPDTVGVLAPNIYYSDVLQNQH